MTNKEKARERARQVFPCPNEDEQRRIVELAYNDACQWKDKQFKDIIAQVRKWLDEQVKLDQLDLVEFDMEIEKCWEGQK